MKKFSLVLAAACLAIPAGAGAATISLVVGGNGGLGLLGSNAPTPVVGGGSGDAFTLEYDDVTNVLTYDIRWGSGNGFTDLSSAITVAHIHGATANGQPTSFGEDAGIAFNLISGTTVATFDSSITSGSATGTWDLDDTGDSEADLLAGKYYFNIHTVDNGGGEIRGYIIPEPSRGLLVLLGLVPVLLRRRR